MEISLIDVNVSYKRVTPTIIFRAFPVSAVSQLSSAQNNYARVVHLGVTGANPQ